MSSILSYRHGSGQRPFWHSLEDGRLQCDLCPRECRLQPEQRGACFVRGFQDGEVKLLNYGRSSGFCVDPIEKKPLNHFYPGSSVLSFGTAGCNLACKFCQNWDITKAAEYDALADGATPKEIVAAANHHGCASIAFTYNDPVIFHEYAVDVALAARAADIKSVAVTAGYIKPEPRRSFFAAMDAANVDLKGFTENFYHKICGASLAPVLDTLLYLKHETKVWIEITTLLIPNENDSDQEIDAMTAWIASNLGLDVPLHFTAFHPDHKMRDKPGTPQATLHRARRIAQNNGLRFVYTGNVHDAAGGSTYCPTCQSRVIERDWYQLGEWKLNNEGQCAVCNSAIPGHFLERPGNHGRHRQVIRIERRAD